MAFNLGNALGGAAIGSIGGLLGSTIGGVVGGTNPGGIFGEAPKPPAPPAEDPRLKEIRERQINQAKDYRANMANEKDSQAKIAQDETRRNLATRMAGINTEANHRGLLYSGLKQGAQYGAQGDAAADLASKTSKINEGVENRAQALDSQALTGAYQGAQNQGQMSDINMQRALQERQARSGAISSLSGAIGTGIGLATRGGA